MRPHSKILLALSHQVQQSIFEAYLHLQHASRAEVGRLQRWRCSWLYLLRACLDAEEQLGASAASVSSTRCLQVVPPNHPGRLGWGSEDPSRLTDMSRLLFAFRCW